MCDKITLKRFLSGFLHRTPCSTSCTSWGSGTSGYRSNFFFLFLFLFFLMCFTHVIGKKLKEGGQVWGHQSVCLSLFSKSKGDVFGKASIADCTWMTNMFFVKKWINFRVFVTNITCLEIFVFAWQPLK